MAKPALTKRLFRVYQAILDNGDDTQYWMYRNAAPFLSSTTPDEVRVGWQAYYFAKRWSGRDIDLKRLQRIVLRSPDAECSYSFAKDVPGVNIRRLARHIMECGNSFWMRKFADRFPNQDSERLRNLAVVHELMVE